MSQYYGQIAPRLVTRLAHFPTNAGGRGNFEPYSPWQAGVLPQQGHSELNQ